MTTTPSDRIRLLIVDDHPIVRDGLVSILHEGEPDLEVVGEAGDGKEAVEAWRTLRPSVTIMDLQLPGQSGVEAIKAIRREDPEARILVLTTFDGDADIQRSLGQAGLLAVGAVFGAQSGAWLSRRLHGGYIIRALAVALVIVGFRLALKAIQG